MLIVVYVVVFYPFRASDWKLDAPDWDGRLRVVAKGKELFIKLEDKTSGMGTNLYYRDEFNSYKIFMSIKWVGLLCFVNSFNLNYFTQYWFCMY